MSIGWFAAYFALGTVTGFFAGLLGIGGGLILVSALALMFSAQGFSPDELLHLALGTSMATVLFTSVSSLRAHHAHGAVLWPVVKKLTPGLLLGTLLGTLIASRLPSQPLALFFSCFVVFVAIQMVIDVRPKPSRQLPTTTGMVVTGTAIGSISSLVAIGGGALTVPFLTWCNIKIHHAIGTSAATGFPIALGGSIGYLINGWNHPALPQHSLGFIYLPALIGLVATSTATAPFGARIVHRLPVATIKRYFAGLLILLAGRMLYNVLL